MKSIIKIIRLSIVASVCKLFLPRHVFVGKHFGAYTQRFTIMFGKLDNRGVLQGKTKKEV